ncbi:MAG: mechanosensitive ion channel [Sphingomonas bacterium]
MRISTFLSARRHSLLLAGAICLIAAAPPHLSDAGLSAWDAIARDIDKACGLWEAQSAQPIRSRNALIFLPGLVLAAILLVWPIRLWLLGVLDRLIQRFDRQGRCRAPAKAVIAIFMTTLLAGIAVNLVRAGLDMAFVLLPPTRVLADTAAAGLVIAGLGQGIGRALRSPDDPAQRPLAMRGGLERSIGIYPLLGGVALGFAGFIARASIVLHVSRASWLLAQALLIAAEAVLIAGFLVAIGRSRDTQAAPTPARSAGLTLTAFAWAAILLGVIAFLLGYAHFAVLLFQELIWASFVVVVAMLCVQLAGGLIGTLFGTDHATGRFATHIVGLRPERVAQIDILATGAATLLIWMLAIGLIAAPLGGEGASLVDQVQPGLLLGELHKLHFAPQAIAMALAVLVVGVTLTRILRRWLERSFLPATSLDIGVRSSIVTGLSYAGIVLALIAATNALGINLDKITLIASALSVGIGFGLQSIIQNFVSGVILLVERPIKIGDWVVASGAEGSVRRIKVRATELAASDGSVTIVPNSLFISANVQNRAGAGIDNRIDMTVKVTGSASPAEARDAILGILKAQPGIGKEPGPRLLLTEASDAGFGFTVHAHGDAQRPMAEVRSDLVYALVEGFSGKEMKAAVS